MNIVPKILNKTANQIPTMYKKNYIPRPSGIYPRYSRLVQHPTSSWCNPLHQQAKEEKYHMITSIHAEKAFDKTLIPIYDKDSQ